MICVCWVKIQLPVKIHNLHLTAGHHTGAAVIKMTRLRFIRLGRDIDTGGLGLTLNSGRSVISLVRKHNAIDGVLGQVDNDGIFQLVKLVDEKGAMALDSYQLVSILGENWHG